MLPAKPVSPVSPGVPGTPKTPGCPVQPGEPGAPVPPGMPGSPPVPKGPGAPAGPRLPVQFTRPNSPDSVFYDNKMSFGRLSGRQATTDSSSLLPCVARSSSQHFVYAICNRMVCYDLEQRVTASPHNIVFDFNADSASMAFQSYYYLRQRHSDS